MLIRQVMVEWTVQIIILTILDHHWKTMSNCSFSSFSLAKKINPYFHCNFFSFFFLAFFSWLTMVIGIEDICVGGKGHLILFSMISITKHIIQKIFRWWIRLPSRHQQQQFVEENQMNDFSFDFVSSIVLFDSDISRRRSIYRHLHWDD